MATYESVKAQAAARANLSGLPVYMWHDGTGAYLSRTWLGGVPTMEQVNPGDTSPAVSMTVEAALQPIVEPATVDVVTWLRVEGLSVIQPIVAIGPGLEPEKRAKVIERIRAFGVLVAEGELPYGRTKP